MIEIPVFETERLILRCFRESDFEVYARYYADPLVMRYLGGEVMKPEDTWRNMAFYVGHWQLRGFGYWAVEERSSGRFVGRVGVQEPHDWPGFELGWLIGPEYQGKGFATEAARRVRDFAFGPLDRDHFISIIHPDNAASIRVAEKIGERRFGETTVKGIDALVYRLDRETGAS